MKSLLHFNVQSTTVMASSSAVVASLGEEKIGQLVNHSSTLFGAFASSVPEPPPKTKRSLTLFHGPSGQNAAANPQLNALLRSKRFLCAPSSLHSASNNLRAFLSPHFATALPFGTRTELSIEAEGKQQPRDEQAATFCFEDVERQLEWLARTMTKTKRESSSSNLREHGFVVVRSVLALRLDLMTNEALPVLSETGPILGANGEIYFLEDTSGAESATAVLSYFDLDAHDLMNFAVVRNVSPDFVGIVPLGLLHSVSFSTT